MFDFGTMGGCDQAVENSNGDTLGSTISTGEHGGTYGAHLIAKCLALPTLGLILTSERIALSFAGVGTYYAVIKRSLPWTFGASRVKSRDNFGQIKRFSCQFLRR